jgi:hypothetical protein
MDTDRSDRFELRLTKTETNMLRSLAGGAGISGADYLRQLLRKTWDERRRLVDEKLERLAIVSLAEMTGRAGIACAVVFTTPFGASHMPGVVDGDRGPSPRASNVLEAPMIGNVVCQGFSFSLSDDERAHVEKRFPNQTPTWSFSPA